MKNDTLMPPLFLDANVLFGSLKRDLLITCAEELGIEIAWSAQVLAELSRNLLIYFEEREIADGEVRVSSLLTALRKT